MPIPREAPAPLDRDTPACAADTDGDPEALEGEPNPLHTSPVALLIDGEVALAPALVSGATELANTDCPPWVTTPAVAPRIRAANCAEADEE